MWAGLATPDLGISASEGSDGNGAYSLRDLSHLGHSGQRQLLPDLEGTCCRGKPSPYAGTYAVMRLSQAQGKRPSQACSHPGLELAHVFQSKPGLLLHTHSQRGQGLDNPPPFSQYQHTSTRLFCSRLTCKRVWLGQHQAKRPRERASPAITPPRWPRKLTPGSNSCHSSSSAHGYSFAGSLNMPSMDLSVAPDAALSITMRPKITPDSPTAQLPSHEASLHARQGLHTSSTDGAKEVDASRLSGRALV